MSTNWVNFAEIRAKVSLEDVLFRYYRLDGLRRSGTKVTGPCPVHGGDNPRAFTAELTKNVWHCFTGCAGGGNQLDFVARKEGISIRNAALALQRFIREHEHEARESAPTARTTSSSVPTDDDGAEQSNSEPNAVLDLDLDLDGSHDHLTAVRGLSPQTIAAFGAGYVGKGTLRGCIAIPIRNAEGSLVAYAGRRLRQKTIHQRGKYVFPRGFRKELELFNFHRARSVMETEGLVLVEGFFTVMHLAESGIHNAVAVMGSSISRAQCDLVAQAPEVTILFDGDEAGQVGGNHAEGVLKKRTRVRTVALTHDLDPDDLSPRTLRWLVRGMRELDLRHVSLAPFDVAERS